MSRWLLPLLLLANLGFWGATREPVARALGLPGEGSRDPGRLALQVQPEAIKIHTGPLKAPPPSCLQAGPFNEETLPRAETELREAGLPAGGWVDIRRGQPARWALVLGPWSDKDQIKRKQEDLRRRNHSFDELKLADGPALDLGQFNTEAEAQKQLGILQDSKGGLRGARVLLLSASSVEHQLRAENLSPAQAQQLLAPGRSGRWKACSD